MAGGVSECFENGYIDVRHKSETHEKISRVNKIYIEKCTLV